MSVPAIDELSGLLGAVLVSADGAGSSSSSAASTVDWRRTASLAQNCADSLRTEQARSAPGVEALIQTCALLLQECASQLSQSLEAYDVLACQTQLCRVVGNAVLDHPENRKRCLAFHIPQRILKTAQLLLAKDTSSASLVHTQAVKACIGALLNLTIDTPEIRNLLVQLSALDVLSRSLSRYRVPEDLPAGQDALVVQTASTAAEWMLNLVRELVSEGHVIPSSVAQALGSIILSLPLPGHPSTVGCDGSSDLDEHVQLVESSLNILSLASEILETHAYDSTSLQEELAFGTSATIDKSALLGLLDFVGTADLLPIWQPAIKHDLETGNSLEADKTLSHIKAAVARVAVAVVSSDKVMDETFRQAGQTHWLLDRCLAWLDGRADLLITSSTMLANLARKDMYCTTLVQIPGLVDKLTRALKKNARPSTSPQTSRPGESIQVLHGVCGLLKNLAISPANKQTLKDAGIIEPCSHLLRPQLDMVVALQNAAVGILKHLCAGNVASALAVVLPPTSSDAFTPVSTASGSPAPLQAVLDLIPRTHDVRLKCEATRLLGNIVRSLYSARSVTSPVTPSVLHGFETDLAKSKARDILSQSVPVVEALSELLRTGEKYPVLVNEAIVALTLLSTTADGAALTIKAITEEHEVPTNAPSTSNGTTSPQDANDQLNSRNKPSKSASLMTRFAPASGMDILLRWLNEYAIESVVMPPEMAGNALSLLETLLRSEVPQSARDSLPQSALHQSLEAVLRRNAPGPHEQALQNVAKHLLNRLA